MAARIDPLGANTSYRLEYGLSDSYEHVLSGDVGEGMEYVLVSFHRQDLLADTDYHYRLVTISEVGTVESGDRTFRTQSAGNELALPDGRAWELVSPANKEGALISPAKAGNGEQAASDGSGIAYRAFGVPAGEDVVGNDTVGSETLLSRRGVDGWHTQDLQRIQNTPALGEPAAPLIYGGTYGRFSSDLSKALGVSGPATPLSPETASAFYVRNNIDENWTPIFTHADLPVSLSEIIDNHINIVDATPDLSDVLFLSPYALTPGAVEEVPSSGSEENTGENLYEWDQGQIQLVSIMPHGEPYVGHVLLAGNNSIGGKGVRTVSSDGRRVAWTVGDPYNKGFGGFRGLFVRDMLEGKTVRVGGASARYQTMNSDGSRIFFLEKGELYEYDMNKGILTGLTNVHGSGVAGVLDDVSDVSEDGSYAYFVATGVLATGATSGADNLYLAHEAGGQWSTSFIATLSGEDEKDWHQATGAGLDLERISSRV